MARIVLIAEDEPASQKLAVAVVESCRFDAKVVSNGRDCLDLLRQGIRPELILLDLEMPVLSGLETLEAMKEEGYSNLCPIVVLTGKNQEDVVLQAVRLGATDYVVKPFHLHELTERITDLIFNIDESQLRKLLLNLNTLESPVPPSLRTQLDDEFLVYRVSDRQKTIGIAVAKSQTPKGLAYKSLKEIMVSVQIFRKCSFGWRKVWPLEKHFKN